MEIKIIGAGLTGLIAAHIFPQAKVYEANTADNMQPHKALLRFRSDAVSEVTGIPFRKVIVRKGIFDGSDFVEPSIRNANAYSNKCLGKLLPRSIWNLEPCERWIAPDDFIHLLQEQTANRTEYGRSFDFAARKEFAKQLKMNEFPSPVISTVPMGIVAKQLRSEFIPEFRHRKIEVCRLKIACGVDVHQTVYFPYDNTPIYRASITGNNLILESTSSIIQEDLEQVERAFYLSGLRIDDFKFTEQKFGKIAPIDDGWRRHFIHELSDKLAVYSLGRFGTWRNILLDDTVHDCAVIKRLMFSDSYTKGIVRAV